MIGSGAPPGGGTFVQSVSLMGTVVTIQVVVREPGAGSTDYRDAVERAFDWFREVEASCSRFDPAGEVADLSRHVGKPVAVSATLFHATEVALAVAAASGGAFDPTVGARLAGRGFNRNHRTGEAVDLPAGADADVSFRDVVVDPQRRTIMLQRPLVLDLGAVAKGLAIDLAARELAPLQHYAIDAGGDLYLAGLNEQALPWRVGIRHPRQPDHVLATLQVSGLAVCTSGDYERPAPTGAGHHIVDPRTGSASEAIASVTVVAPSAVLADALGTAAFVLGAHDGLALLERHGVDGLMVTTSLDWHATRGMQRDYEFRPATAADAVRGPAILRDAQGPVDDPAGGPDRDRGAGRGPGAARSRPD
jgi:thiamine biosynthesis lipoprotein